MRISPPRRRKGTKRDLVAQGGHCEITRYETLIAWAEPLERPEIASILLEILDEDYAVDNKLTATAKSSVNSRGEAVVETS